MIQQDLAGTVHPRVRLKAARGILRHADLNRRRAAGSREEKLKREGFSQAGDRRNSKAGHLYRPGETFDRQANQVERECGREQALPQEPP